MPYWLFEVRKLIGNYIKLYGDREMSKRILLLTVLLALMPFWAFSQSIGKIVGVVKDKASGETLPGVNVSLEGTTYGAATDIDGYFVILNVPVGTYDVRASFIGYQEIVYKGVRVSAGKTTEQNYSLDEAAIEGQAVVVTAEKPLVDKNVTQSVSLVTSEDLENMPIRGFNNVVATQNSVVVQDGNIYIRGGRDDEVGYYIDGASSVNPLNNTQSLHIIQEAVEEFQVLAGGYTAEFGGANSGIIRTELKSGGNDFKASVDFQTDKFADEGEEFLGTYSYRHHNAIATLSGPLAGNKVRFFVAAENQYQGDRSVRFSEAFSLPEMIDGNPSNTGSIDTVRGYNYPAGFTPQREEDLWALQSTLLFDFSPVQFRVSGSYSDRSQQFNSGTLGANTPMLNVMNDRTFDDKFTNLLLTGKMTYILSPKSFVEGSVSMFNSKLDREDSYFGNDWQQWYDSSAVSNATGGDVTFRSRYKPRTSYLLNGWTFARNGEPENRYRIRKQDYLSGTLNFVTQAGRHHELKIGGDYRRYTLREFQVLSAAMDQLSVNSVGSIEEVPIGAWISNAQPINYGYDIYGNEADDDAFTGGYQTSDAPKNPVFGSFYLQDKIEYNDLIINAGLRFDYFDPQGERLDIDNLVIDQNTNTIAPESWKEMDVFQNVSPRLGFSFPVSEKTNFYMQYGKFIQMPELEAMYTGSARYNYEYVAAGFSFQNPSGFGLEPVRTTSYEIGFRQQISSVAAFDMTGFYRNVKGQVQLEKVFPEGSSAFNILVNGDFATTKGMELGLTLRRINRIQGQINYTLSQAEGTGSTRTTAVAAWERGTPRPNVVNPLDFAQTHRGSINMDYRYGRNDGGPILQNLGANVLFTFNSGHPFTFAASEVGQADAYTSGVDYMNDTRARKALEAVGSSNTPWNYQFDLRLDKSFNLTDKLGATVYMRVNNLFNTQNVLNVYNATGNAEDDGFYNNTNVPARNGYLESYGEDWLTQYEAINIVNGQAYWDQLGLQLYGNPRQIFFGIKLSY
jgi:hypothetical protein